MRQNISQMFVSRAKRPRQLIQIGIVSSHGTVFLSNRLELSPSLEYNSRNLSISPNVKTAIIDIVF